MLTQAQRAALELLIGRTVNERDQIREVARLLGVRYATLSERSGLRYHRIEKIFRGVASATPDELRRLREAVGLTEERSA